VPKNKKIGAISAHNCLQAGGEASIQNRDFNNSRLIGSDMPRYKYGKIMDRWLFGEKKILWCQFIIVLELNSRLCGMIPTPKLSYCNFSPKFLVWDDKSGWKTMPPSPMNSFLPRRRGQRTPEKYRYISTRLQRVYRPENNNVHRRHPREHQSHNSSYNIDRHFLSYNVSRLHSGRAYALVQAHCQRPQEHIRCML